MRQFYCTPRTVVSRSLTCAAPAWRRSASRRSAQERHVEALHVGELLVLAAHRPAERVARGATAGVNGPRWRERDLAVAHDDVLRGVGSTEQMEDDAVSG